MTDYFALLGESRRPFLDPERIKGTFHRLSRSQHPDQQTQPAPGASNAENGNANSNDGGSGDFATLNIAQQALRDPKTRLRHLLELEYPQSQTNRPAAVPAALADQFAPVHQLLRNIDAFLPKKATATSALTKALLAHEETTLRLGAQRCLEGLEKQYAAALEDLQTFDAQWEIRPPDAAERLLDFYQRFAYLSRWIEQLRERLFQLDL